MLQAAANAFRLPDVRRKLLFTFGILIIYRIAAAIPVPAFDSAAFNNLLQQNNLFQLLSLFAGGSGQLSIVMLGVYPYITAQIAIQILQPVIPRLEELMREGGEAGRQRINQITRIVTVPLAMLQALGQGALLSSAGAIKDYGLFNAHTTLPTLQFLITTAAGTMFLIWLGELITENGIGNGVSIIIFAGIIARLPSLIGSELQANQIILVVILAIVSALVIAAIVFVQQAQRRIPVQYAKRVVGRRVMQGQSTFIPIPVNSAGMIPLIFAISIVTAPYIIASYFVFWTKGIWHDIANFFYTVFGYNSGYPIYWIIYFLLVVGFTYFYTAIQFQQQRLPETLQKNGGFIPGYRPGQQTASYLTRVVNRVTIAGALFLGAVALLPYVGRLVLNTPLNLTISATALLIIVGVVIDTMRQLEAQLMMRNYQSFIR
jgi:preprotein translocase subunit SecY